MKKIKEICKYCMKDVELVRKIYKRMVFEEEPKESPIVKEDLEELMGDII